MLRKSPVIHDWFPFLANEQNQFHEIFQPLSKEKKDAAMHGALNATFNTISKAYSIVQSQAVRGTHQFP